MTPLTQQPVETTNELANAVHVKNLDGTDETREQTARLAALLRAGQARAFCAAREGLSLAELRQRIANTPALQSAIAAAATTRGHKRAGPARALAIAAAVTTRAQMRAQKQEAADAIKAQQRAQLLQLIQTGMHDLEALGAAIARSSSVVRALIRYDFELRAAWTFAKEQGLAEARGPLLALIEKGRLDSCGLALAMGLNEGALQARIRNDPILRDAWRDATPLREANRAKRDAEGALTRSASASVDGAPWARASRASFDFELAMATLRAENTPAALAERERAWTAPLPERVVERDRTWMPLASAARDNDPERLFALIAGGANPNAVDWRGDTALMELFGSGHGLAIGRSIQGLRHLLDVTDPRIANHDGQNALMRAAEAGHAELVFRLARRCDPNARDRYGRTALFYALSGPGGSSAKQIERTQCAQMLALVSDVNAADGKGETLLMQVTRLHAVKAGRAVDALLAFGADPKLADHQGQTALMHAARIDSAAAIEQLLPLSDLDAHDERNRTALEHAEQGRARGGARAHRALALLSARA